MKHSTKIFLTLLAIFLVGILQAIPNYTSAEALMYINPTSASVANGGQINLQVRGNATTYNAAQISLIFDASALEYINYSNSGSVLPESFDYTVASGRIDVTVFSTTATNGDQLLATFSFKALKKSGNSSVSFVKPDSALAYDGGRVADAGNALTVTFTSPGTNPSTPPAQIPIASPSPTQPPTSSPKTPATTPPASQASPAPLSVVPPSSDIEKPTLNSIIPIGIIGEVISLKVATNEPVKATVRYGETKDNLQNTATIEASSLSFYLPLGQLSKSFEAGKTYYYSVELTDAAGNKTVSAISELPVESITVKIVLKDKDGNILPNSLAIINGKEYTTDENGTVELSNVIPGLIAVSLKSGDKEVYLGDATIVAGVKNQGFEASPSGIVAGAAESKFMFNSSTLYSTAIAIVGLAIGILIIRSIRTRQLVKRDALLHSPNPWGSQVTPQPAPPTQDSFTAPQPSTSTPHVQSTTNQAPLTIITPTPSANHPQQPNIYSQYPSASNTINDQSLAEAAKKIVEDK